MASVLALAGGAQALIGCRSERRRTSRVDADEDPSLLPGSVAEPSTEIEFRELVEQVRRATVAGFLIGRAKRSGCTASNN